MEWTERRPVYDDEPAYHIAEAWLDGVSWTFRAEEERYSDVPSYKAYVEIDDQRSYGPERFNLPSMEAAKTACIEMAIELLAGAVEELRELVESVAGPLPQAPQNNI